MIKNNEKFLKHILSCLKRRQESYVVLYRTMNPIFVEYENRLKKVLKEGGDVEGIFKDNVLKKELLRAVDIEFESEFNNKRFKTSFFKAIDPELSKNLYQKDVLYKKEEMVLPNWKFKIDIDCKEWFTLIDKFNSSNIVSFDTGKLRYKYRVELLQFIFRIFPTVYINSSSVAMIAYCFADVKGFSKFGSYTGNGSTDGTFVYTGFKPAFVMVKRTDSVNDWCLYDGTRDTYNVVQDKLQPNQSSAESNDSSMDFVSNGFKFRFTGGNFNASGGTYIYMAFAENPFVTSTSIPTTAR